MNKVLTGFENTQVLYDSRCSYSRGETPNTEAFISHGVNRCHLEQTETTLAMFMKELHERIVH